MVAANELCCALEELLAIQYDKLYRSWKEQAIINLARAIAAQYRTETNSLPSETALLLKPPEAKTFEEGLVEEFSETTSPDAVPLSSFSSVPAEVTPELTSKSAYWSFDIEPGVSSELHQRHPALPD